MIATYQPKGEVEYGDTEFEQPSAAEVDVHIGIGIPAPPPITLHRRPRVVALPRSEVYYAPEVTDYNLYRIGGYWYMHRDGYWYRSRSYRGPYQGIEYGRLPRAYRRMAGPGWDRDDRSHRHGHRDRDYNRDRDRDRY